MTSKVARTSQLLSNSAGIKTLALLVPTVALWHVAICVFSIPAYLTPPRWMWSRRSGLKVTSS